jgi:hypothetical protein
MLEIAEDNNFMIYVKKQYQDLQKKPIRYQPMPTNQFRICLKDKILLYN